MGHQYEADKIPTDANDVIIREEPCNVVKMTGYLVPDDVEDERYRLYESLDFRRWITIRKDTIKARAHSLDQNQKGQSHVWLDSTKTIVACEAALVSSYQPQPRGLSMPGDEDLEYPKR